MKRSILAVLLALAAWLLIATVANRSLRMGWPEYAAVERAMTFSFAMQLARLAIGALATLGAGAVAGYVKPGSRATAGWLGGLLLLVFVPDHVFLWEKFPVWYHAFFLASLVPLAFVGSWLGKGLAGSGGDRGFDDPASQAPPGA